MHMYMSIFIITYTYIPYLHMLSKSSIHIGHHPNLSVPPRSAFSPSSTGREMQYMLKAKLEHQNSLPKTRQNTRSQLRGHLTKVRYPSCQGIWICFTFPACRVHVCMLLCMFRVDTTMKIDEIHCTIGRCSPVHLKFPVGGS